MPDPDVHRAVHDAVNALTVARLRTHRLLRRLDGQADGYAIVATELATIQALLDRLRDDLRAISDATGGKRSTDIGQASR